MCPQNDVRVHFIADAAHCVVMNKTVLSLWESIVFLKGKHRFPEGKALLCRMVCIDTKKKRTLLAESLLYSCFSVLA